MHKPVMQKKLENGLTVMLKEIHTAPIISHWIWYRVGSRNESAGKSGVSHWVEHMLFKGTPTFPVSILDKAISRDGGYWNGMTYLDWTTFFETMPSAKIDLALRLEADRMVNGIFDPKEVESERTVIISERQGSENEPLFRLGEALQSAAFQTHPYRRQVIGDLDDLRKLQRDNLYQHYCEYYVPNNAVLAIAGDFNTEEMLDRIEELYSPVTKGNVPIRQINPEPTQSEELYIVVEGPGETTFVQIAYHIPEASHADILPLTVLDSLLTGPSNLNIFGGGISNKTSRLYRTLVERELAVSVQGGLHATIDPFLDTITIIVHPQRNIEQVLSNVGDEINRLQDSPPPLEEIHRAVKQARALFAFGSESITNQAFWMGFSEMFANYDWFLSCLDNLAKVTPEQVQRVAQQYLTPRNRVIGHYKPTGNGTSRGEA